jgi:hypothetical protein
LGASACFEAGPGFAWLASPPPKKKSIKTNRYQNPVRRTVLIGTRLDRLKKVIFAKKMAVPLDKNMQACYK